MQDLLQWFISSFRKAIALEMEAMRRRLGPFEVPVCRGKALPGAAGEAGLDGGRLYALDVITPNEKLVLHTECTLVHEGGEHLVTVVGLEAGRVEVQCDHEIPLGHSSYALVIYPWFLYERLRSVLDDLLESEATAADGAEVFARTGLKVFGKIPPAREACALKLDCAGLNESQQEAIRLCAESDLAFVWGPPGTGKTTTLGRIVAELAAQGLRVLVTSTTNAAVDQALAHLARIDEMREAIDRGAIVRIGQGQGETFGAQLTEATHRIHAEARARQDRFLVRSAELRRQARACEAALSKLAIDAAPAQADLFVETAASPLALAELGGIFSEGNAQRIHGLPPDAQRTLIARRKVRLEDVRTACKRRADRLASEIRTAENGVVHRAQVLLATMTQTYISPLLRRERFDAVIIEEAGMAILPAVFFCASLSREKVIVVGDPKQLPPIVQSNEALVRKAMGRSIFDVTVPRPHDSVQVAMLDIQYRMHPTIGDLVSDFFYEGRLKNGPGTEARAEIAEKEPYPGAPLVVVDTAGQSRCATEDGSYSRFNEATARLCAEMAVQAARGGIDSVAIITPYAEQSRRIRRHLSAMRHGAGRIECHTVHRFQGNERDLVILDTVDAAPLPPGVLLSGGPDAASRNLLNVSLSGLVVS